MKQYNYALTYCILTWHYFGEKSNKQISLVDCYCSKYIYIYEKTEYFKNMSINPTWKNIYLKNMSNYISAKNCIILIYFAYILFIKMSYIWHIFQCHRNIYFRVNKLYTSHIYFVFMGDNSWKIVAKLLIDS